MNWRYLIIAFLIVSCGAEHHEDDKHEITDEYPSDEVSTDDDWEMTPDSNEILERESIMWDADSFDVELEEELSSYWTYSMLFQVVMSEFPEAYEDFVEISYEKVEDRVNPDVMSFVIPTKKLEEIDSSDIEMRFERVALKMNDFVGCQWYEIGESETYSWHAWDDKQVTRIYYHFMFGC